MFSTVTVSPLGLGALSQLSSVVNAIRTSSEVLTRSRPNAASHAITQTDALSGSVHSNQGDEFLTALLSDLPDSLNDVDLCPLIADTLVSNAPLLADMLDRLIADEQTHHDTATVRDCHASAATFFENKTGFPESMLHTTQPRLFCNIFNRSLLSQKHVHNVMYRQQLRGFKTRRTDATGLGLTSTRSALDDLFEPVNKRQTKGPRSETASQLKELVLSDDLKKEQPNAQDKESIAFAKGYAARSNESEKDSDSSKKMKITMKYVARLWFPIGLAIFLWFYVKMSIGSGTGMGGVLMNKNKFEINPEDVTVTFADVCGADEAKQELRDVVDFLKDPDKFTALGGKLPKGVLLVGPPGIGKTLLARAVAGEAGVPFFHASGSEFDEMFVGLGARRVRNLFQAAKAQAPCVVFIDEIDAVGAKRTNSSVHPYANQTINQLLSEMDGFTQNEGVIVLGATNRKDNLDKAILRAGRFDVEVRVRPPDLRGRTEILQHYLSKIKKDPDVDADKLAKGTTGFTGADLENLVNQAALHAAGENATTVTSADLDFARDKVLMGPAKKYKIPDQDTNWNTAYHEAGHTIVAYFTRHATTLHKVTIIPRGESLGHTSFIPEKELYNKTKSQLLAEMDVSMGGRVAEEHVYGQEKVTTGASYDFAAATSIATAMVKQYGMSDKVGVRVFADDDEFSGNPFANLNKLSPAMQEVIDSEIHRLLQESYERAKHILKTHSNEHKLLAQKLMDHETLDLDDIKTLMEGKKLVSN